jgi:hypothetical protein
MNPPVCRENRVLALRAAQTLTRRTVRSARNKIPLSTQARKRVRLGARTRKGLTLAAQGAHLQRDRIYAPYGIPFHLVTLRVCQPTISIWWPRAASRAHTARVTVPKPDGGRGCPRSRATARQTVLCTRHTAQAICNPGLSSSVWGAIKLVKPVSPGDSPEPAVGLGVPVGGRKRVRVRARH